MSGEPDAGKPPVRFGEGGWWPLLKGPTAYSTTAKVWTTKGMVDIFVLFFIHAGSRRVLLAGMKAQPDGVWMTQQACNMAMHFAEQPVKPTILLHDLDSKYTREFDALLASEGVSIVRVGPRAPNMNAHAERWVLSVRSECLDHFIVVGEAHLRHILSSYVAWYNGKRPHQSLNNEPLAGLPPSEEPALRSIADIHCEAVLGGLLNHYSRKAA